MVLFSEHDMLRYTVRREFYYLLGTVSYWEVESILLLSKGDGGTIGVVCSNGRGDS